jgi:hypothetical protein
VRKVQWKYYYLNNFKKIKIYSIINLWLKFMNNKLCYYYIWHGNMLSQNYFQFCILKVLGAYSSMVFNIKLCGVVCLKPYIIFIIVGFDYLLQFSVLPLSCYYIEYILLQTTPTNGRAWCVRHFHLIPLPSPLWLYVFNKFTIIPQWLLWIFACNALRLLRAKYIKYTLCSVQLRMIMQCLILNLCQNIIH